MTTRVLLALLALAFSFHVEAKNTVMVVGAGQASCGTWTKAQAERQPTDARGNIYYRIGSDTMIQLEWVRGFISAFNIYKSETGNVTAGTDMDGVYAWIDNYCAAHPLDNVVTAALALVQELSQRQSQRE
jgi:hypothetical protein